MGALHDGHLSLVTQAKAHCDKVLVSIFVNPLQFSPNEDYSRYPRPIDLDINLLQENAVDAVFTPSTDEILPQSSSTLVHVPHLGDLWCGHSRPGHFDGVTSIVARLFHLTTPTHAFFGEKDFQQLRILQKMTQDLFFPIQIIPCPILREPDGLAMSSRNQYLSPGERQLAPALFQTLNLIADRFHNGELHSETLLNTALKFLGEKGPFGVDYIGIVDAQTLEPVSLASPSNRILIAAKLGHTRLIDNLAL